MNIEKPTFKHLCFMYMQQLTNFPYIEKDFDAITDYGLLCRVVEYLNQVIENSNVQNTAIMNLYNAFIALKDYVDNYFDSQDWQSMVDNKLEEMAESGELLEIISQFLQSTAIWCFDTIEDLKDSVNLISGSYAQTLGYYAVNDGGSGLYKITDTASLTEHQETLDSGLYATLIIKDVVNAKQLGAYGDGTHDDTSVLQESATLAQTKDVDLLIPQGTYLTDTITLEDIGHIRIEGVIKLSDETELLNIFENVNGKTPSIFVNRVTIGDIVMKGLNSADITIQNAHKLILLADNTAGHGFIAYNTFKLGYIRYLEIKDDGSGTRWINENLFLGGRFLGIEIGGGDSTYNHNNNLFLKPQCENTIINIVRGIANRIIDARLEENALHSNVTSITFGQNTYANVITSNYAGTHTRYFNAKYYYRHDTLVTDYSGGQNKFINNADLNEHVVLSINKFNNPKELTIVGDNLTADNGDVIFESDFIAIPNIVFLLQIEASDANLRWRITCYDENFELLTENPNFLIDPQSIVYITSGSTTGTYGNVVYSRKELYGLFDGTNESVKYIKVRLSCTANSSTYKNIDMYMTYYGKLLNEGYFLKGFAKCLPNA